MSPLLIPALAALPEAFCRVEEQAQRVRLQEMLCSDLDECLHSHILLKQSCQRRPASQQPTARLGRHL